MAREAGFADAKAGSLAATVLPDGVPGTHTERFPDQFEDEVFVVEAVVR